MKPERVSQMRKDYHRQMEEVEEILTQAMCEVYQNITGKIPSDRMREEIANVVRFNA